MRYQGYYWVKSRYTGLPNEDVEYEIAYWNRPKNYWKTINSEREFHDKDFLEINENKILLIDTK